MMDGRYPVWLIRVNMSEIYLWLRLLETSGWI